MGRLFARTSSRFVGVVEVDEKQALALAGSVRREDRVGLASQLTRRRIERDPSAVHHDDAIGNGDRPLGRLLHEQHREAVVGLGADRLHEPLDRQWREAERQLVDEQDPGRAGKCPRQCEHLLLAPRQQTGPAVEQWT